MSLRSVLAWPAAPAFAVGAILIAGAAVSLAFNLPGHMSYDSVLQLAQGRSGVYNTWHPPVMAWLLGLGDALVRGTALFVALDTLLLFGAAWSLLCLHRRTSWWALAPALVSVASVQWLIYPGIVWKDVLFAGAAVAGFTLLAHAAVRWRQAKLRGGLIAGAVLMWSLAALTRQNGLVALGFGAVTLGVIAALAEGTPDVRKGLGYGLGAFCVGGLIVAGATVAFDSHSDGRPERRYQIQDLQIYDLTAAVHAEPGLELTRIRSSNPQLETLIRTQGVDAYTPQRIDTLVALEPLQAAQSATPARVIAAQWGDLIVRHPLLYLKVRTSIFGWMFLTPKIKRCVPFYVGVDGPQPAMSRLGLVDHIRPQDLLLKRYGLRLTRTPLFSHALYAALAGVLMVALLRRRRAADLAIAAMLASALVFTASFLVVSVACDYRYLYFLDVAAMVGALYLATDPTLRRLDDDRGADRLRPSS